MIKTDLEQRILILDGAMGSLLQAEGLTEEDFRGEAFREHGVALKGNNEVLNLTRPELIARIHRQYAEAGADIIETNTFGANALVQEKYGCAGRAEELSREGARIARQVADEWLQRTGKRVYVAGSMGPTGTSLTLATGEGEGWKRATDFDTMAKAYAEQAKGLIEGGADVLLVETIYDGLNAKAALYGIGEALKGWGREVPVMLSATVNDRGGRTLTGQTLEALYTSLAHVPILSFGLNCSFGISEFRRFARELAPRVNCYFSIYPNAGLPDEMGCYRETPDFMAQQSREMAEEGLVNIAGGCCGTTPEHTRALAEALRGVAPRQVAGKGGGLHVSGLEEVVIDRETRGFTPVGERTNVAGSAKFARLIREKRYEEALAIGREQIEGGAAVLDINLDDALLDSRTEMERFVRLVENDPGVARAALMIDSSDWDTIVAGLKNSQGKCIVNSISLKDGEEAFKEKARELKRLGAAVVVMAFDEAGQATDYERKISICQRAYQLLTGEAGFAAEDIIFDVNILAIGTGMEEHRRYAVDFIEAVRWIKTHLPGCHTSGGVSNLSFAFRGNNAIRRAIHGVFLYHATLAGLDMAIVNPGQLDAYEEIDPELREAAEDLVLDRDPEATGRLLALAERYKSDTGKTKTGENRWKKDVDERLAEDVLKGTSDYLAEDCREALAKHGEAIAIIEGPLMRGMEQVGALFGEGKMFLPQVVKSAQAMKEAVALLQPEIDGGRTSEEKGGKRPRVVVATVKGDVHDIGKNIVSIVLECNNWEVIDLGVMVDNEEIVRVAREQKADVVGVSGLITPSLKEMEALCELMQREGMQVPLIVGGATTSAVHTAVKLAPKYDGGVVNGGDASQTASIIKRLLKDREGYIQEIKAEQARIREAYESGQKHRIPLEEARRRAPRFTWEWLQGCTFGEHNLRVNHLNIEDVTGYIDWTPFFHFWGFKGKYPEIVYSNEEAERLHNEAVSMLGQFIAGDEVDVSLVVRFFDAHSEGEDIVLDDGTRLPMPRQRLDQAECWCLADFIPSEGKGSVGLFCIKVDDRMRNTSLPEDERLLRESLCARLTEAAAEWMQRQVEEGIPVIRPAFGYPACPDHALKKVAFELLDAPAAIGVRLTDHYAIVPTTSLCGLLIAHPRARYFSVGIEFK